METDNNIQFCLFLCKMIAHAGNTKQGYKNVIVNVQFGGSLQQESLWVIANCVLLVQLLNYADVQI